MEVGALYPPLGSSAQERLLEQVQGPQRYQRDGAPLIRGQTERVGVNQSGEQKTLGRPFTIFWNIKEVCKKDGDRLFSKVCYYWKRGNGFKESRLRLDIKKNFFTVRELKYSRPLLLSFSPMETVKVSLERLWVPWSSWSCPSWLQGVGLDDPKGHFQCKLFYVSSFKILLSVSMSHWG